MGLVCTPTNITAVVSNTVCIPTSAVSPAKCFTVRSSRMAPTWTRSLLPFGTHCLNFPLIDSSTSWTVRKSWVEASLFSTWQKQTLLLPWSICSVQSCLPSSLHPRLVSLRLTSSKWVSSSLAFKRGLATAFWMSLISTRWMVFRAKKRRLSSFLVSELDMVMWTLACLAHVEVHWRVGCVGRGIGFLADMRRMNVGLTRAKCSLFVLGNAHSLNSSEYWGDLVYDAQKRNLITDVSGFDVCK